MARILLINILLGLLLLAATARAQFNFFEQMFGGGGEPEHDHDQRNVPSDSTWYQKNFENAHCSKYLCPGTLACVHFPHHCPCPHPSVEEKFELGDGSAICVSKGGYKGGEAARKVELARKGLI